MAISVDNVYQKVLALANKEQRGYITPQEFNLFADHAQMEIFEQYFYDVEQFERRVGSDITEQLEHKIQIFKESPVVLTSWSVGTSLPANTYQIEDVWLSWSDGRRADIARVNRKEVQGIKSGPLLNTPLSPCYFVYQNKLYLVAAPSDDGVAYMNLIRKPVKPNWTYVINPTNQSALYNPNAENQQDFELHISEEPKLVIKILQLAGVNMKDYNLAQLAGQKEASVKQQEKQ